MLRCIFIYIHMHKSASRPTDSWSFLQAKQMLAGAWSTGVSGGFRLTTRTVGASTTSLNLVALRDSFECILWFESFPYPGIILTIFFNFCLGNLGWWFFFFWWKAVYMWRCAILSILQLHPQSLVLLAPVCSGFSFMSSSQAQRFFYTPLGNEYYPWVKSGNVMSCRVTLLCWLCCALGHVFILEQPSSARFGFMPRWRYFCDNIAHVTYLHILTIFGFDTQMLFILIVVRSTVSFLCRLTCRFSSKSFGWSTTASVLGSQPACGPTPIMWGTLIMDL